MRRGRERVARAAHEAEVGAAPDRRDEHGRRRSSSRTCAATVSRSAHLFCDPWASWQARHDSRSPDCQPMSRRSCAASGSPAPWNELDPGRGDVRRDRRATRREGRQRPRRRLGGRRQRSAVMAAETEVGPRPGPAAGRAGIARIHQRRRRRGGVRLVTVRAPDPSARDRPVGRQQVLPRVGRGPGERATDVRRSGVRPVARVAAQAPVVLREERHAGSRDRSDRRGTQRHFTWLPLGGSGTPDA